MADFILGSSLTIVTVILAKAVGRKSDGNLIAMYGVAKVGGGALIGIQNFANTVATGWKESGIYKIGEIIVWIFELLTGQL